MKKLVQSVFLDSDEAIQLWKTFRKDLKTPAGTLLSHTVQDMISGVDSAIRAGIQIPGSGPGGGAEHERHKTNGNIAFDAARLWLMNGNPQYAQYVLDLLLAYAKIYAGLPFAVPYSKNPPGRLFHQIMNEHMWLLSTSAAWSAIRHLASDADRRAVETGLFEPLVQMFTVTYAHRFDILHNHGMWASASVGICGIACKREDWVQLALVGQHGDSQTAGFLAQLSTLFSISGYYKEGPYYQRFAIQPMLLFAEAYDRYNPAFKIYDFHHGVIKKGFYSALQASFPDGRLLPLDDCMKTTSITNVGYVMGTSLVYKHFGHDMVLLSLAKLHGKVWPDAGGVLVSKAVASTPQLTLPVLKDSVELSCGPEGNRGAVGILRHGHSARDMTMVTLDYAEHGIPGHCHFDSLVLGYYNRGREVLREYGSVRWINVEPKKGGSYLKENTSFAKQTIAHNTMVVDQTSQFFGDDALAVGSFGRRLRFDASNKSRQLISAELDGYNPGVVLRRTVALVSLDEYKEPLLIDVFSCQSATEHSYDYVTYYNGQVIRTNLEYETPANRAPLGSKHGYQHLWLCGTAQVQKPGLLTWLDAPGYQTCLFDCSVDSELLFVRTGASDPQFNLREEPAFILRFNGKSGMLAAVHESHGFFNEEIERSEGARGTLTQLEIIHSNQELMVLALSAGEQVYLVALATAVPREHDAHEFEYGGTTWNFEGSIFIKKL